jgi:hypothetical protein
MQQPWCENMVTRWSDLVAVTVWVTLPAKFLMRVEVLIDNDVNLDWVVEKRMITVSLRPPVVEGL